MAKTTTPTPSGAGTVTRTQPEPTTSAMTKQVGGLPPADATATRNTAGTARGSNEQQTGVTEFTVSPGRTVRAQGRNFSEGQRVPLNARDGARLVEQGTVQPVAKAADGGILDANADEAIASVRDGDYTAEELDQLDQQETDGKDRKTVHDAIEAKRQALAGDGAGE